jgi:prepilin-type N-terminal cleavage/methylation domain-containing protein
MRQRDIHPRSERDRRRGFTLIELLVVIAIIAFLLALTASAVMKFMLVQQNNNTQTTLNKVQSVLNQQWSAAKDQAWKETIPSNVQTYIQANLTGNDANVTGRTRVIYVKLRMRQLFPMNFTEALSPLVPIPGLQPLPSYQSYLGQLGITGSTGANYESSACLFMAMQTSRGGVSVDSADLGGGGAKTAFALPSGMNINAFGDAWGRPLYFTRVPAGYSVINPQPYPGPPGPGELGIHDPGDPQGYLNAKAWLSSNTTLFTQLTLQPLAGSNCSYKLVPMLASSGPDGKISDPTWFSAMQSIDNDNLYSNP